MTRKEKLAEELKKLKSMGWKARIVYIWDYYKVIFVILLVGGVLINIAVTMVKNINTKVLMNAVFFNCDYVNGDTEGLTQQFIDSLGGIEKNEMIKTDFTLMLNPDVWDNTRTATETKVTAYNLTGELDCMVMTEDVYRQYQTQGLFQQMELRLTQEEQSKWKDYLVLDAEPDLSEVGAAAGEEMPSEEDKAAAGEEMPSEEDKAAAGEEVPAEEDKAAADEEVPAEEDKAAPGEEAPSEEDGAETSGTATSSSAVADSREAEYIYGIRLDSSKVLKQYGLYTEDQSVILAMPGNSENSEYAVKFLEFLLEE
ncbi:MAG: hypothetical protein PHR92_10375 [Lachnospiraceae bacterium]|nr:hypothetical protein [Lachnospiraceae bacterium]